MKTYSRTGLVPWSILAAAAVVYCGWAFAPSSPLYARLLTPGRLIILAAVLKMTNLLAAALWAFACRDRLEEGNPARPAWALLAVGLGWNLVGQMSLAPYQLLGRDAPYPSVGDLFYILAYPFLIGAFVVLLRAYRKSGFPMGSRGDRGAIMAGVGVIAAAVALPILRPVVAVEGPLLERILTVAYPILDLVLLVPLALLLRVALHLRGSHVGSVWALVLGGMVFLCLGDILFAYLSALGRQHLDALVHATFILAYGLIAGGTFRQRQLLRS